MLDHLDRLLATDLGVAAAYRHAPKQVTPGEPLATDGALFKWYQLAPPDAAVPAAIETLARAALATGSLEARGLGAVVLHRCGGDFYFLIACTWRNENELWQTVLYKDATMPAFALFPRDHAHKPTLCVWELVPVWHEQRAWTRFLASARGAADARRWLDDVYAGPA
jgi:hypothetical protein